MTPEDELEKATQTYDRRPQGKLVKIVLLTTPIFTDRKALDSTFREVDEETLHKCEEPRGRIAWPLDIHNVHDPSTPCGGIDDLLPYCRPGRGVYHYPDEHGAATLNVYRDWVPRFNAGRICMAIYGGENATLIAYRLMEVLPILRPLASKPGSPHDMPLEPELDRQFRSFLARQPVPRIGERAPTLDEQFRYQLEQQQFRKL